MHSTRIFLVAQAALEVILSITPDCENFNGSVAFKLQGVRIPTKYIVVKVLIGAI